MRKLSLNNILCIQLDEQTKQLKILVRDGDTVWITNPMPVRTLTLQEVQQKDHEPDRN